ncbi:DUF4276 family protein [Brevundimonas albigilva]|uniref:DUF4276 family protein n=1 Tax=Brevundimonas albigilva TaxID=1312364 RepID=A0ABY4SSZ1_9CAUL|nr:DUF4276 family protein [Brevundimonas albigilva]URI15963.1 DUF4276 family protein [Brevundimonas albigilva]
MPSIAMIVEGPGDISAFPTLVAKTGAMFGMDLFANKPIKAGGYHRLALPGQVERFVEMAAGREGIDSVMIAVDLDDGCPRDAADSLRRRAESVSQLFGKPIKLSFCVREYESWILHDLANLKAFAAEYNWDANYVCNSPEQKRGAKEAVEKAIQRKYKEISDQQALTKKLNLKTVYVASRSYRKFCKEVTGLSYGQMAAFM